MKRKVIWFKGKDSEIDVSDKIYLIVRHSMTSLRSQRRFLQQSIAFHYRESVSRIHRSMRVGLEVAWAAAQLVQIPVAVYHPGQKSEIERHNLQYRMN